MIVLDTSGLLAALDRRQRHHERAAKSLVEAGIPRLLSPFVLAELDYLLARRSGRPGQVALLEEVARGTYKLEPFLADDVAEARAVMDRYADLEVGLADASIVVLANRYRTERLLTLDERHFRTMRGPGGKAFRLLPADTL